jgi:chitinase
MTSGTRCGAALVVSLALASTLVAQSSVRDDHDNQGGGRDRARLVGYFIEWGIYSGYFVKNVLTSGSAERLTHIDYAFANVAPASAADPTVVCQIADSWADYVRPASAADAIDGVAETYDESVLHGNFNQLRKLKAMFPRLKIFMSLGGFTFSSHFSDAARTDASRRALVTSCVDMFIKGQLPPVSPGGPVVDAAGVFDGIDIDWEWPGNCLNACPSRPEDTRNFTLLLQEFRRQLDAAGRHTHRNYGLSAFMPAGASNIDNIELARVSRSLDFMTIQGYDLHGAWEPRTNFHSALFSSDDDPAPTPELTVDFTVDTYLRRGVPRQQVVIGVPFYGRGWSGVSDSNNGLFQSATGAAPGAADYKSLNALEAAPGWNSFNDSSAVGHWIFNPSMGIFWSFDDAPVLRRKARYVERHDLGGIMFWELSGDDADGTLVRALHRERRSQ